MLLPCLRAEQTGRVPTSESGSPGVAGPLSMRCSQELGESAFLTSCWNRMLLAVVSGISILGTLGLGRTGRMGDASGMLLQKLRTEGVKWY